MARWLDGGRRQAACIFSFPARCCIPENVANVRDGCVSSLALYTPPFSSGLFAYLAGHKADCGWTSKPSRYKALSCVIWGFFHFRSSDAAIWRGCCFHDNTPLPASILHSSQEPGGGGGCFLPSQCQTPFILYILLNAPSPPPLEAPESGSPKPFGLALTRQRRIRPLPAVPSHARTGATPPPRRPLHHPRLQQGPAQQARRGEDEDEDDRLVLDAVALEAGREHVFFLGVGADRQLVRQAEGPVAGCAGQVRA